jgi:hypothetical protein
VKITIPGDKSSVWNHKVNDEHRLRWPDSYKRFKEGVVDRAAGGTPLKDWPVMTIDRINFLNTMHIYTCEQLRDVHDGNLVHLGMGSREEHIKVKAWLEERKSKPSYEAMEKRMAELEEMVRSISEQPEKRGRPRKTA